MFNLISKGVYGEIGIFRFLGKLDYLPGQFTILKHIESGLFRPYSITSISSMPFVELFVHNINGKMTSLLFNSNIGELFDLTSGKGTFNFNNEKKAVFIAGGVGAAPIISILRHIEYNNINGDFHAFLSFKTPNIPYISEFMLYKNTNIHITFTREEVNGFHHGRFSPNDVFKGKDFTYYICGSKKFAHTFSAFLKEHDVEDIKVESWG